MVTPKQLANLHPRKKGDPPLNPSGKNGSEDRYLTGLIRKSAHKVPKGELWDKLFLKRLALKGKTYGEILVESLWEEALVKREPQAYKLLVERCDGKMPLPMTGEESGPVQVRIVEDAQWGLEDIRSLTDVELEQMIRVLKVKDKTLPKQGP